jgi:hypothetical protein
MHIGAVFFVLYYTRKITYGNYKKIKLKVPSVLLVSVQWALSCCFFAFQLPSEYQQEPRSLGRLHLTSTCSLTKACFLLGFLPRLALFLNFISMMTELKLHPCTLYLIHNAVTWLHLLFF